MTAPHQSNITMEQLLEWRAALRQEKTAKIKPKKKIKTIIKFKMKLPPYIDYDEIAQAIDERIRELKERNNER